MSFVEEEDVLGLVEGLVREIFRETMDIDLGETIPRYTYAEAMDRYGVDKPDTRFGILLDKSRIRIEW